MAYSAPLQNEPSAGIDGDAAVIAPAEGEVGVGRRSGLGQRGRLHGAQRIARSAAGVIDRGEFGRRRLVVDHPDDVARGDRDRREVGAGSRAPVRSCRPGPGSASRSRRIRTSERARCCRWGGRRSGRPPGGRRACGRSARVRTRTLTLSSSMPSVLAAFDCSKRPKSPMPALLTSTSTPPSRAAIFAAQFSVAARSERSHAITSDAASRILKPILHAASRGAPCVEQPARSAFWRGPRRGARSRCRCPKKRR